MTRLASPLAIAVLTGCGLAACGGDAGTPRAAAVRERPAVSATPEPAVVAEGKLGRAETVRAQANIFGAGHELAPAPAGGGTGVIPPVWRLPDGDRRVVSIPATSGRVNPIVGVAKPNGPGGDGVGATDVTSWQGISGIVHRRNGMFLVGVFLTDDPPTGHAPPRLDFSRRERFESLAPRIGQTFFVGDGKGRSYRVPSRATRLYLGFADGYLYKGAPGWYGNNSGELRVTVKMSDA